MTGIVGNSWILFLLVTEVPALHIGQHQVEHDQFGDGLLPEELHRFGDVPDAGDAVPSIFEHIRQRAARPEIVLDDENLFLRALLIGRAH